MELWYVLSRRALAAAWRHRWLVVATVWLVCILGWVAVYMTPNTYESQARLYVDTDAVLTPLLRGLAIDTATSGQLEMMQKTLLSRPNLEKLVSTTSLNVAVSSVSQREQLIQSLGQDIKLGYEGRSLFTIRFRHPNPKLAYEVVSGLINIFLGQASANNRSDMDNAQKFLRGQIALYEKQLRGAEQRRADFRKKYLDILPLDSNGGYSRLDDNRISVLNLEAQVKAAVSKRDALKQEVETTPPMIAYSGGPSNQSTLRDQLAVAELKLFELRVRLTEDHPDVVTQRRLIESIKVGLINQTEPRNASSGSKNALPNPLYEQLKIKLVDAEATIVTLSSSLERARAELGRMEGLAGAVPQVDAEYQALDRDYNVLRKNYEELLARREQSNISAAADNEADKVRLRVIDAPQVPNNPIAPNRVLLISLVLLGGTGAAVAVSVLLSQADRSISELGQLRLLGVPVLGGISLATDASEKPRKFGAQLGVAISVVLLLIVYGALVNQTFNIFKAIV